MTKTREEKRKRRDKSRKRRFAPQSGAVGTIKKAGRKTSQGNHLMSIERLQDTVTSLLEEGANPVFVMETLTAIGRNLAHPLPPVHRLPAVIVAASELSLSDLGKLDKWLCARIADEKKKAGEVVKSPGWIVMEERKAEDATYRLVLVKCGRPGCRKCRRGPAHGPYWYEFRSGAGKRASRKYIGKTLDPQVLASTVRVE